MLAPGERSLIKSDIPVSGYKFDKYLAISRLALSFMSNKVTTSGEMSNNKHESRAFTARSVKRGKIYPSLSQSLKSSEIFATPLRRDFIESTARTLPLHVRNANPVDGKSQLSLELKAICATLTNRHTVADERSGVGEISMTSQ